MYKIEIDADKNRMYVTLGAITTGEGKLFIDEIKKRLPELKNNFSVVSDISGFSLQDPAEAVWADKILKELADAGMERAVRVTGHDVKYRESKEKYGYTIGLARTVEDADKILDAS